MLMKNHGWCKEHKTVTIFPAKHLAVAVLKIDNTVKLIGRTPSQIEISGSWTPGEDRELSSQLRVHIGGFYTVT